MSSSVSDEYLIPSKCQCSQLPNYAKSLYQNILNNRRTIRYVQNSKVMLIMRGLPGSGKSSLSLDLCLRYPEHVLCSADHFFSDPETKTYNFDPSALPLAHEQCRNRAIRALESGVNVVIIDNTNIGFVKELYPYVAMAIRKSYLPIVIESITDWSNCAFHLSKHTKHGVDQNVIISRLAYYSPISYLYCGLFPNRSDCDFLCRKAIDISLKLEFAPFQLVIGKSRQLHLTTHFLANKRIPSEIQNLLGCVFGVQVVGFVFTATTTSVRVRLCEPITWVLFRQPDSEAVNTVCEYSRSFEHPTCGWGRRAHMTLWTEGVRAVQVGIDLIDLVRVEHDALVALGNRNDDSMSERRMAKYEDDEIVAKLYDDKIAVYLHEPIDLECILAGGFRSPTS